MSTWTVYWVSRLDSILFLATVVLILAFAATAIYGVLTFIAFDGEPSAYDGMDGTGKVKCVRRFTWMASVAVGALLVLSFVPSTKEACVIYVVPKLTQGVDWGSIPKVVSDLLMKTCGVQ